MSNITLAEQGLIQELMDQLDSFDAESNARTGPLGLGSVSQEMLAKKQLLSILKGVGGEISSYDMIDLAVSTTFGKYTESSNPTAQHFAAVRRGAVVAASLLIAFAGRLQDQIVEMEKEAIK